jgi:glycerophosphoryl diester phosphodiesterase
MTVNRWLREGPALIVAHRGANAYAPENTLAAFRLTADRGADAIEFDVRAAADGVLSSSTTRPWSARPIATARFRR